LTGQINLPSRIFLPDIELTIKPAKQKKRGKHTHVAKTVCKMSHCPQKYDQCTCLECTQSLNNSIQALKNENSL
jgi:hypothetical protein